MANDFFDRTEIEQLAAESSRKAQQEKDLAVRNEQAAEIAATNARSIKDAQERSKRALEKVVSVVRNSTTSSAGPPMSTLERVGSFLGAAGTANAAGHAINEGARSQAELFKQGKRGSGDQVAVTMDVLQKFVETYAQDVTRGVVQAATGVRMNVPGKRIEGVDLMKMAGATGTSAKVAGVALEVLTDPTSAGKGLVPWGLGAAGSTVKFGVNQLRRIPQVNTAYTGVARSLNKFHDIDQLSNAQAIKDAFQAGLDSSGNVDITKLTKSMEKFGKPVTPEIGTLRESINKTQAQIDSRSFVIAKLNQAGRGQDANALISKVDALTGDIARDKLQLEKVLSKTPINGAGTTKSHALRGMTFDKPVADLIDKELSATFVNYPRNTISEKVMGGMKDVTTTTKKLVTVIDPVFHVRNFFDGIYKNILEQVSIGDYRAARKVLNDNSKAGLKLKREYAEKGILGQVGMMDVRASRGVIDPHGILGSPNVNDGWLQRMSTAMNDNVRLPHAMKVQRSGGTLSDAGTMVNQTHIDYRAGMTSPLINALSNRYVPFAKYEVGNPWSYLSSMPRYSGRQSMAEKIQRNTEDEKDPWKRSTADRGRMSAFGYTGLQTSFEDLASIGDKGIVNRLLGSVNSLVKLTAEKLTGWDSWRGRPLNNRESGKKFENMPDFFKDMMAMRQENGKWTISGPRLQTLSVFNRGIGMGANYLNAAEGNGSWLQSMTGIRPVQTQEPWMIDRERRSIKPSSWKMPWSTPEAQAGTSERWKSPYAPSDTNPLPVSMVNISLAALQNWANGVGKDENGNGGKLPVGMSDPQKMRMFLGSQYDYFSADPNERSRQRLLDANFGAQKTLAGNVGRAQKLGQQFATTQRAKAEQERREQKAKGVDPAVVEANYQARMAAIGNDTTPLGEARKLPGGQLDRSEGATIKDRKLAEQAWFSYLKTAEAEGEYRGPARFAKEAEARVRTKMGAVTAAGLTFTPAQEEEANRIEQKALIVKTQEWQEEWQRKLDVVTRKLADAMTDPRAKLDMEKQSDLDDFMHSKETREKVHLLEGGKLTAEDYATVSGQIEAGKNAIVAVYAKKASDLNTKLLQDQATQLETFMKEKSVTAVNLLKNAFESGTMGISSFYDAQRKVINDNTDTAISGQMTALQSASGPMMDEDRSFVKSMLSAVKSGDFETIDKNRNDLMAAGVNVDEFFKIALEISKLINKRTGDIAALATSEKATRDQYDSALAGLKADTAGTDIKTKEISLAGPSLADMRGNFTAQFDAESAKKRVDMAKTLNYSELSPGDIDEKDPKELENYYTSKAALAANDEARERLRAESLAQIDRNYWLTKCKQAQVGTDTLVGLTTQLYELSGKKSREMFYMMKAASVASAMVKGYEAAVSAWASGNAMGGPWVGGAYVAMSMAMTSAQIANIVSQQMAEGGPVRGGSGKKDDVPIMAMGGEFMMKEKAVQKYGENFMNAINEGKADPKDFVIPAMPSRRPTGSAYSEGGLIPSGNGVVGETTIVLENKTNQNMKMSDGGTKFDGKKMVRSIIMELADTDPGFAGMFQGGR